MKKILTIFLSLITFASLGVGLARAYDPLCSKAVQQSDGSTSYVSGWQGDKCTVQGAPCQTAPDTPACKQDAKQQTAAGNPNPIAGSTGVLQTITNIMALLTGIVAVVMIIVSGISFMTAGGNIAGQRAGDNPSRAKKARAQLSAAVIGLLIVALSWTILSFIIQKFVQS